MEYDWGSVLSKRIQELPDDIVDNRAEDEESNFRSKTERNKLLVEGHGQVCKSHVTRRVFYGFVDGLRVERDAFMYFQFVYDGVRVRSGFIGRGAETKEPSARSGAIKGHVCAVLIHQLALNDYWMLTEQLR